MNERSSPFPVSNLSFSLLSFFLWQSLLLTFSCLSFFLEKKRNYVLKHYGELKSLNPSFPFLIREKTGIAPQIYARYGIPSTFSIFLLLFSVTLDSLFFPLFFPLVFPFSLSSAPPLYSSLVLTTKTYKNFKILDRSEE